LTTSAGWVLKEQCTGLTMLPSSSIVFFNMSIAIAFQKQS